MADTSVSLLERLRTGPEPASWRRLVDLYQPLIRSWLDRQGLAREDAEDLTQEVLAVVVRDLPRYQHNRQRGAFRRWLRLIAVHRARDFWRRRRARPVAPGGSDFLKVLDALEDPDSSTSRVWDREHDRHVARRLAEAIRADFQPATWQAFRRTVLDASPARVVATELGLSVNAVLLAKSRVLRRLRQEMSGLVT
jgi:RNA polymerase sigma-70 factor (ECF subfamily)